MKSKYITGIALLGIIISIGMTSCKVKTRYKTPEVNTENMFRDMDPADSVTIADIPWREYFKDNHLRAYIEEAINNNFDMLIAAERIKQAEAALGVARAAYFPDIAVAGQVEQNRLSNADPLTGIPKDKKGLAYHTENYSLGIATSWELDIWNKIRQSKADYAGMLNSYAGRALVQTSLISNMVNTYYSLLALDEQLNVTQQMIMLMEENLVSTEALKEAGMLTGAAVEQTRAALYSTRASVPDLKSNIRQLENTICTLMGRKPDLIERSTLPEQIVPDGLAYGIPAQMLARRPDVYQAELSFRSAFHLTHIARSNLYPKITISSGILGFSTVNSLSNFFKSDHFFSSITGGITQPLFARRRLTAQLKTAKSDQQIALLTFERRVLEAGQEVSDIMYVFTSSQEKEENRIQQVESLNKAVYYTQELLKAGEADYLEVLTAQQGLLQAQLSQINDHLQQLQATSDLYRALGGGVE
ncbi:MAG: efflux transporter outer membrane subunit [Bacteroidales bacterium]|jgi:NodT family efflux transporter outer membrane factor (OMF) lipoprotein|nr:efflux transporter outer membrane subunit [Bacteroidales bacterium]